MRGFAPSVLMLFVLTAPVAAAEQCNTIADDAARLRCWDLAFPPKFAAPIATTPPASEPESDIVADAAPDNGSFGPWQIHTEKDAISDARNVYLSSRSLERVPGRFNDNDFAQLMLSCVDNTTRFVIHFGGAYVVSSEYNRYGDIAYRVDDRKPGRKSLIESTSNEHLGLWNGGSSIPMIKELLGGKKLIVEATPYNENPIQLEFDISFVDGALGPLRAACGW